MLFLLLSACGGPVADDTSVPADTDTDTDADTDTDTDADADTDTDTDTTPDPDWAHCPDATAYVGDDTWTGLAEATGAAKYCSGSNEARTLEQELAAKAMLRVVAGSWKIPAVAGTYDPFALPVCTRFPPGTPPADMTGPGSTVVTASTFGGVTYTTLTGSQPLATGDTTTWTLAHTVRLAGDEGADPDPLVLDGARADPSTGAGATYVLYAENGSPYEPTAMTFQPCNDVSWVKNVHSVTFDGGDVTLDLYISQDIAITAPVSFARAKGTLDGVAFDEDDYFQLIYKPDHHHFGRHFAVLFDSPIGDACGLRIEEIDAQVGTTTAVVSLAACDLSVLGTRAVTGEDWVVE